MEKTTPKDRILQFKDYMGMSMRSFETKIGVSNGYFKSIQTKPSARILECIFQSFPTLNRMWVLTGSGDMLILNSGVNYSSSSVEIGSNNNNSKVGNISCNTDVVAALHEQIDTLNKRIASLENQISNKDIQIDKLMNTITKMAEK